MGEKMRSGLRLIGEARRGAKGAFEGDAISRDVGFHVCGLTVRLELAGRGKGAAASGALMGLVL